jgi:hypothetical protein
MLLLYTQRTKKLQDRYDETNSHFLEKAVGRLRSAAIGALAFSCVIKVVLDRVPITTCSCIATQAALA